MSAIRNSDGLWINTECFRESAKQFLKHGYYCGAPPGSNEYMQYWKEETKRCQEGYSVGGAHITGLHYGYLNYSMIYKVDETAETQSKAQRSGKKIAVKKIMSFPDFWDGDYNYFWLMKIAESGITPTKLEKLKLDIKIREDCLDGGKHICLSKCRRRGFEQPVSEPVLTPNGFVPMGSLKIGDKVIDKRGNPTNVVDIFPQGVKDVYELELRDGRKVRCGINHRWQVRKRITQFVMGSVEIKTTQELLLNNVYENYYIDNCLETQLKTVSIDARYNKLQIFLDKYGTEIYGYYNCDIDDYDEITDILLICRSLGIECFRIDDGVCISTLKDLKNRYSDNCVKIFNIRKLDYQEESQCIEVDSEDHTYLTEGYVVTLNSYKNSFLAASRYNTERNSTTIIGSADYQRYTLETMRMTRSYLDFFNEHTAWKKRRLIDKKDYVKAGYKMMVNGYPQNKGYKSQVIGVTFKDNPNAAHPYSQIVYTPKGKQLWKDITIGSELFDENGDITHVTEIHEKGICDIYKITFNDGRVVEATDNHKWLINRRGYSHREAGKEQSGLIEKTLTTQELYRLSKLKSYKKNKNKIKLSGCVKYSKQDVSIDAYTLGLLLGDGCFPRCTNTQCYLTMMWDDVDELIQYIPYKLKRVPRAFKKKKQNILLIPNANDHLKELDLYKKYSGEKFIPDIYKYNDEQTRVDILSGLLDSDGSVTKDYGVIEYCSKFKQLAKDVLWVAYSLGLGGTIKEKYVEKYDTIYYRVYIYCKPDENRLFKLPRKKERIKLKKWNKYALNKSTYIQIENIEIVRKEISKCVTVANDSHLYQIGEYITNFNSRGKDGSLILFEEAGTFPNLKKSILATKATVEEGNNVNGMIVVFGTGSLEAAGWEDFSEIFYEPDKYNMIACENIWDDNKLGSYCGFHFGSDTNRGGFMDNVGNSFKKLAKADELAVRSNLAAMGGTTEDLQSRCAEWSLAPEEMFRVSGISIFPVLELQTTLSNLVKNKITNWDYTGSFKFDKNTKKGVRWKPDLNKIFEPLQTFKVKKGANRKGAIVIYEHPPEDIPEDMYIIGVDTLAFGTAETSDSLYSAYVYKTLTKWDSTYNTIVGHYVGRFDTLDKLNEILMQLTMYFNATVAFENERGADSLVSYFKGNNPYDINLWHKLLDQPQTILDTHFKNSKVDRNKGIPMNKSMKQLGEKLILQLLIEKRGEKEDGTPLMNLHTYRDRGLLDELIIYNGTRNTDRVSSLMMIAIALEELNLRHKEVLAKQAGNDVMDYFGRFITKKKKIITHSDLDNHSLYTRM